MARPHLSLSVPRLIHLNAPLPEGRIEPADLQRAIQGGAPDPHVAGRVFFSLPRRLLDELSTEFGVDHFDPEAWNLEQQFVTDSCQRWDQVGVLDGMPLTYPLLSDPPSLNADIRSIANGRSEERLQQICQTMDSRRHRFHIPARGYCGWLLTNPNFLAEHDELLTKWNSQIRQHGLPDPTEVHIRRQLPHEPGCRPTPPADFVEAFAIFLIRWRLTRLPAPYLPCPAVPQVPAPMPDRNHPLSGATFFLPDTFPIPSRDELRDMLEDALRGGQAIEHLAEWHDMVRSDNRAKGSVERYGRLFILQHFWMILHHRHASALHRNVGRLKSVMARYLFGDQLAGVDSIHKDLQFIRERLGSDWFKVPDASSDQSS